MDLLDQSLRTVFEWISGPYKQIALIFVGLFVLIGGLELAISFISSYIRGDGKKNGKTLG